MHRALLTLLCLTTLVWNAFSQEQQQVDRAKYELLRETINLLATDRAVSQDTTFSIACEALDYECFDHQLSGEPIAGIGPWYNRWRSVTVTDEAGLQKLRDRIFADIFERPGKGYRKQLAGYDGYVARTADIIAPSSEILPMEQPGDDSVAERVPDHAGLPPIYPEQQIDPIDNPENENPMIAYIAIAIGLIALVIATSTLLRKKAPDRSATIESLQDLHRRLDGIALRMKGLEQKITDTQAAEAVTHLTEIMESVEKRVVDLERRVAE